MEAADSHGDIGERFCHKHNQEKKKAAQPGPEPEPAGRFQAVMIEE